MPADNPHGPLFEQVIAHCVSVKLPAPWDFLPPPTDCHGPVLRPATALALLAKKHAPRTLIDAGVADRDCQGALRLSPALAHPGAAIVALRQQPGQPPFALLTGRGCLPPDLLPLEATRRDHWTCQQLAGHGRLLASPHLLEVLLLRALSFPATLSLGIHRHSGGQLRWLDSDFQGPDYIAPAETDLQANPASAQGSGQVPCTLALLGWSLRSLRPQPSPVLNPLLTYLQEARRYLGLALPGLLAWQLSGADVDNLRFRLRLRDVSLVREFLQERLDSLLDFSLLGQGGSASASGPADYLRARAELLACQRENEVSPGDSQRLLQARALYDDTVRHELIDPLLALALAHPNPVLKVAGAELADLAHLLHQMSPQMHLQLGGSYDWEGNGSDLRSAQLFAQYSSLVLRFGSLLRTLQGELSP